MARRDKALAIPGLRSGVALPRRLGGRSLALLGVLASLGLSGLLTVELPAPSRLGLGGLKPGDIAPRSYKAPADITLVDTAATEEHRRAALETAPVVYDFDERSGATVRGRVDAAFAAAREALALEAPEGATRPAPLAEFALALGEPGELPEHVTRWLQKSEFSTEAQADLLRALRPVFVRRVVNDTQELARHAGTRPVIVRELASGEEATLESPDLVLGPEGARELLREASESLAERPREVREGVLALAETLIRPNLSLNLRATEERRQAAIASVPEVTISLRKGEIIVRDGVRLSESHVRILEGIQQQEVVTRRIGAFAGVALLLLALLAAVWRFGKSGVSRFATEPKDAVFLLLSLLLLAVGTRLGMFVADALAQNPQLESFLREGDRALYYMIPVAAATMLVRLVLSAETAALFAMVAAAVAGLQVGPDLGYALFALVGSLVAAIGATRVTQRGTLLRAGVAVGLANAAVIVGLSLFREAPSALATLLSASAGFVGGCLAGGLVTALAPLAEGLFGYTTDVKLLELANREQPLLRELEMRAPGTYHHSMMVGHLAEKAAEAIGANALLAKVGGYYHDIGKMRRPQFFVENVTVHHGENRHEKLAPSMSARIIQAHVKDGLELGRQYKLVPGIMRAIGEHHGTSIIRFFYEKAKELADREKGGTVQEHDYRYPGPRPQTREAGTLMLADSVEAASRVLIDTSPARIQQLVQRTINNYFRDGQLDDCSLTLRDLHAIARSFIDTLSAIRHERIDYPEPTDAEGRKLEEAADEGVVERLEPRKKDRPDTAEEDRGDDLRRLGLS